MKYPIAIRFKIAALASQISVRDALGVELFYVKQKMFKLRENIEVYHDHTKSQLLYTIKADRVIDFSAVYTLSDAQGDVIGSVKRHGGRSIWRASYDIELRGQVIAHVREENVWAKVADAFFMQIPIVGLFSGYIFHPRYAILAPDDKKLATLTKQSAFLEGRFELTDEGIGIMDEKVQYHTAILLMMVTLLERIRS